MATKFRGRFAALVAVLFNRPLRVKFGHAGEAHFYPADALVLPVIAGADGEGESGDEGDAAAKAVAEKEAADKAATEAKAAEAEVDDELLKDARNPDAVKAAIKAERETAKAAKKAAEDAQAELDKERAKVKEFEDRDKSEQEKAEQRAKDAEIKAEKAERKLLRLSVAGRKKLPVDLADRLQGETEAELEADADKLLKWAKEEDSVSVDGGVRQPTADAKSPDSMIRQMAGRH